MNKARAIIMYKVQINHFKSNVDKNKRKKEEYIKTWEIKLPDND